MSYANGTTHYNLPQTVGSDKRDWSDTNQAFADIDSAIYSAGEDSATALSAAQAAQTAADSAATDAASAVTTANAASASAASAAETAALAQTTATSAQSTATTAESTAQSAAATASNADTVALAAQTNIGTMSNLNTQDKSSLVAAINEVLAGIGGAMPTLDLANKVEITTTAYTTTKKGALVGSLKQGISVNANGTAFVGTANQTGGGVAVDVNFIPSGTQLVLSGSNDSSLHMYFVPYV